MMQTFVNKVATLLPNKWREKIMNGSLSVSVSSPKPVVEGFGSMAQTVVIGFTWTMRDENDTFERYVSQGGIGDIVVARAGGRCWGRNLDWARDLLPEGTVPVRPESITFDPNEQVFAGYDRIPRVREARITGTMQLTEENVARLRMIADGTTRRMRDGVRMSAAVLDETVSGVSEETARELAELSERVCQTEREMQRAMQGWR